MWQANGVGDDKQKVVIIPYLDLWELTKKPPAVIRTLSGITLRLFGCPYGNIHAIDPLVIIYSWNSKLKRGGGGEGMKVFGSQRGSNFFSCIIPRTSYISMRWWWCLLCTRPTGLVEICSASSLKQQSVCRDLNQSRHIILIQS